jgi:hypothetical protein
MQQSKTSTSYHTATTELGPADGSHHSIPGFLLPDYYYIHPQHPLACINQSKATVARNIYFVLSLRTFDWTEWPERTEYGEVCWRKRNYNHKEIRRGTIHGNSFATSVKKGKGDPNAGLRPKGNTGTALPFRQPRRYKRVGWLAPHPSRFTPILQETGWAPIAGLDGCGRSFPYRDSIHGPSSP